MGGFINRLINQLLALLHKRTIVILAILFCAGVTGALWNMSRLSSKLIISQAYQNSIVYARAIEEARTLYSSQAVNRVEDFHGVQVTHDYATQPGAIPLPATYLIELGQSLSKNNMGMGVRLYSDYPFPWRQAHGGARDEFERQALVELRQRPEQPYFSVENVRGRRSLRYAQADILTASCVSCHNQHPDSPKRDWKVGDVRGVLEIIAPLDGFVAQTRSGLQETFLMLTLLSVLALTGIALVINRLRQTSQELEVRVVERTAQLQSANQELALEQAKSERLLLNVLPKSIAMQLKEGQQTIADWFAEVTILFADIVGFTELSSQVSAKELVNLLNAIFSAFDRLSDRYQLEKIKTIGDNYMVASGLPMARPDHAEAIAEMALAMQQEILRFNAEHHSQLSIRIGINTGPVVAGVIGTRKFIYDLWGDAVNTASRMESHGVPGMIQASESTYQRLQNAYVWQARGRIPVKGKGEMNTYFLLGRKGDTDARPLKPSSSTLSQG
ncbi:MAG: DUF3365 domain-containing protein [Desertifilum sp.]|nr:DUF3365 domain-containing protein [Desertifilum sp.]